MKIGFVLDDTLDTPDGVQQYVLTIGSWLTEQGHDVQYLVGQTARTDISGVHSLSRNLKVRFNGNRMSMPLPASRVRLRRLLETEQFDVLHVQLPYSPLMAQRLILAAPAQTAVVGTFHIAPHSQLVIAANSALSIWLRRSLKRFDAIYSVSQAAADFARRAYNLETTIIPNAVVVRRFAAAKPFDRYRPGPTILFLGRLVPRKGCLVFIEALQIVRQIRPDIRFHAVVAGRGPLEQQLKQRAEQHALGDAVEFTGYVSEEDKPRYVASADLAVFPSSGGESFGIVLLEAMAANHPIVLAADNPGYHSVMEPSPRSLFPVNDATSLARRIAAVLSDEYEQRQMRDWQQQHVKQFDVAAVGTRLTEAYTEATTQRRNHPAA